MRVNSTGVISVVQLALMYAYKMLLVLSLPAFSPAEESKPLVNYKKNLHIPKKTRHKI